MHDGRDGRALIRGQAMGMPNQLAAQIVSALESYIQEKLVTVQSHFSPVKSDQLWPEEKNLLILSLYNNRSYYRRGF